MNPIHKYFHDIWLGVTTTLVGMNITFKHFFMPTITVQYPHQKLTYPPRARAALVNTIDLCNGCQQCARACPVNIIKVVTAKALPEEDLGEFPDGKKRRLYLLDFTVDMSKCVYCGFCVDACPTEAIHWEAPHQAVGFSRDQLRRDWARMNPEDKKRLLEREAAAKAAKAAAPAHGEGASAKPAPPKPATTPKPETPKAETAPEEPKQIPAAGAKEGESTEEKNS
jgi:NADH-quinone oxidoreductase subunit I